MRTGTKQQQRGTCKETSRRGKRKPEAHSITEAKERSVSGMREWSGVSCAPERSSKAQPVHNLPDLADMGEHLMADEVPVEDRWRLEGDDRSDGLASVMQPEQHSWGAGDRRKSNYLFI